jgi:hypothetical protein
VLDTCIASAALAVKARFGVSLTRYQRAPCAGHVPAHAAGAARLLPHFYFHVVTTYAILRHSGVAMGKEDYLNHIGGYIRPTIAT